MIKTIYKVYCGKNGKYYTYLDYKKAEKLYFTLMLQNYHTALDEITDGKTKRLLEHKWRRKNE